MPGRAGKESEQAVGAMVEGKPENNVEALIARMRGGDRVAAAEFIQRFGARIRRRVRPKLGLSVRRLFDSEDILSTVSRRLDAFVAGGQVAAKTENELWALVFRITARALLDKVRVCRRLRLAGDDDGAFASAMLERFSGSRDDTTFDLELERVFRLLDDETDRQILAMWLHDTPSREVSALLGIPEGTVRWRWARVRGALREQLQAEAVS